MLIEGGIACDYCSTSYHNDFIYYSWDFHLVNIIGGRTPPLDHILSSKVIVSYDVCTKCWENFKKSIIENYSKGKVCEVTGEKLSDTYYYVVVTSVDVKMSGQPNICTQCNTTTDDVDNVCKKCGNSKFRRHASVSTDRRLLEFNVSEKVCVKFRESVERFVKIAGQWTTNS
jgi:hypothetical protein